jgi:hypothetical protein
MTEQSLETDVIRVGFRYRDGEVLSPEREALSEDVELPVAVIDLGDGEWLTLAELRDMHGERLEQVCWPGVLTESQSANLGNTH